MKIAILFIVIIELFLWGHYPPIVTTYHPHKVNVCPCTITSDNNYL